MNPNKAHGHGNISIRMLKICGLAIYRPLEIIFQRGHKKGDKQVLKNYRPVPLLPICGKIFERLIFNEIFSFLLENNLVSPNQSGFKPRDSCLNQL